MNFNVWDHCTSVGLFLVYVLVTTRGSLFFKPLYLGVIHITVEVKPSIKVLCVHFTGLVCFSRLPACIKTLPLEK